MSEPASPARTPRKRRKSAKTAKPTGGRGVGGVAELPETEGDAPVTGHDHGDDPPADAILIEICTSCRGSRLASRFTMDFEPGPQPGIFPVLICLACAGELPYEC